MLCCAAIFPSGINAQDKLTKFRFVHLEANGAQAVLFVAKEAKVFEKNEMNVDELIDHRFVQESDDSGFVMALYGGK